MAFCIMRMAKAKSTRDVTMTLQHNTRERMPQNANPEFSKFNTYQGGTTAECLNRFNELKPKKVRANAVHAIELVFTASPDFEKWGEYLKDARHWGLDLFGIDHTKNDIRPAIHCAVHCDESTPHMHLLVMPLKDGKLNANYFIGGSRDRMTQLQNDFYEKVGKKHGLLRGESKAETKARHTPHTLAVKAAELQTAQQKYDAEKKALRGTQKEFEAWKKETEKKLEARETSVNNTVKNMSQAGKIATRLAENLHGATSPEIQKFWPQFWAKVPAFMSGILQQVRHEIQAEHQAQKNNQQGQTSTGSVRPR